jgi:hypothetical protein
MTSSKPTDMERGGRVRRTGHGAASVIPHLNVEFALELSHLSDEMPEDAARDDDPARDTSLGAASPGGD